MPRAAGHVGLDAYGHGTHMAGIIAGRDAARPALLSTKFAGVAPDAELLRLKVATGDGGADVTQMIAAIDWVVQHKNDNGMNIRVLNISYGTHRPRTTGRTCSPMQSSRPG